MLGMQTEMGSGSTGGLSVRRPLLRIAVVFIMGLIPGFQSGLPWGLSFSLFIGLFLAALSLPSARDRLVLWAILMGGWSYGAWHEPLKAAQTGGSSGFRQNYADVENSGGTDLFPRLNGLREDYVEAFQSRGKDLLSRDIPSSHPATQLIQSLALGLRSSMDPLRKEQFRKSGSLHVFAISGLHIALIATLIYQILQAFRLPHTWVCLFCTGFLWAYAIGTGGQPSAIRATIISSVILLGKIWNQPDDFLSSLSASALLILVLNPIQLFDPGFQLSFIIVTALVLSIPWFQFLTDKLPQSNPLIPDTMIPLRVRLFHKGLFFLANSLGISLVAFLASFPLTLFWFGGVSPSGLLGNVIVVPLTYLILASCLASGLFWLLPILSACFNHAAWLFMSVMVGFTAELADLPFAFFQSHPPSVLNLVFYYLAFFTILACKNGNRSMGLALVMLMVCASLWMFKPDNHVVDRTILSVLPCEGGDAIFYDPPGQDRDILIDCATEFEATYRVTRFLQRSGVEKLRGLVLTHGDVRHVGGSRMITELFNPDFCWISPYPFRSKPYREAIQYLSDSSVKVERLKSGDFAGDWKVLLPPEEQDYIRIADDGPLVLKGDLHGWTVLLVSDLSPAGQNVLCNTVPEEIKADVLVTGLPSEGEPLVPAFLHYVQPRVIVVSSGLNPATSRCPVAVRERLCTGNSSVWFTETEGVIRMEFDSTRLHIENEMGRKATITKF